MTEMWKKVVEENGFYVTTKCTNVREFLKLQGVPDSMMDCMEDYKLCWKICGDKFGMREYFGEKRVDFRGALDQEADYHWMEGMPASKYCVTRTAPGKYTSVVKDAEGRMSEWKLEFCGEGLKIVSHTRFHFERRFISIISLTVWKRFENWHHLQL